MGIPTGFAFYLKSLHGLITTYKILEGTGNNMVNSGHTIGTGRTFIKNKRLTSFPEIYALMEGIFPGPFFQYFLFYGR
jgi:hypothetical protein